MTKTLTVPSYTESDEVNKFIDRFKNYGNSNNNDENVDDLEYIGDVSYCCEDAPLSTKLVNVYKEDGTVQTKNFCRRCIRDSLVYALGRMYDENTDTPIMNRIFDNNDFINPISLLFSQEENPFIPMGQLIWSFIFDSDIATPARTYVTALALQTLKNLLILHFVLNTLQFFTKNLKMIHWNASFQIVKIIIVFLARNGILMENVQRKHLFL